MKITLTINSEKLLLALLYPVSSMKGITVNSNSCKVIYIFLNIRTLNEPQKSVTFCVKQELCHYLT